MLQYVAEERGVEEGRKVKRSVFSTSENELKLFLVPAAAYNGKNEDWPLPKKWAVRNNRCEISATSLARSVSQTAWEPGSLLGCSILRGTLAFFAAELLFLLLSWIHSAPHPWMQLTANIHVLTSMCKGSSINVSHYIFQYHINISCLSSSVMFTPFFVSWKLTVTGEDRSFNTRSYYMRVTKKARSKKPI